MFLCNIIAPGVSPNGMESPGILDRDRSLSCPCTVVAVVRLLSGLYAVAVPLQKAIRL